MLTSPRFQNQNICIEVLIERPADPLVEKLGLQEDLPVGDGDHVGRDEGRHVAGLGLSITGKE